MKHAIVCAAALASLLAVPLSATEGHKADKDHAKAVAESGHHRMADRMKEKLGLNDEQAKKLDAAWQEHRKAVESLQEQLHKALRKVHGELEIEAPDKDIQTALDQVEKARESLRAEADKLKKNMEALLTPTQRAKMLLMREKMMRRGARGPEDWWARGHDEDRGERHGPEGWRGRAHDQEQEQEDDD